MSLSSPPRVLRPVVTRLGPECPSSVVHGTRVSAGGPTHVSCDETCPCCRSPPTRRRPAHPVMSPDVSTPTRRTLSPVGQGPCHSTPWGEPSGSVDRGNSPGERGTVEGRVPTPSNPVCRSPRRWVRYRPTNPLRRSDLRGSTVPTPTGTLTVTVDNSTKPVPSGSKRNELERSSDHRDMSLFVFFVLGWFRREKEEETLFLKGSVGGTRFS